MWLAVLPLALRSPFATELIPAFGHLLLRTGHGRQYGSSLHSEVAFANANRAALGGIKAEMDRVTGNL